MSEYVVGVDEVGRGSLVGSTIICAFRSQNSLFDKLPFSVSDSKKINKKKREEIYEYFRSNKGLEYNYQIIEDENELKKNQSHCIRGIFRGLCRNSNKGSTDIFAIYAISC